MRLKTGMVLLTTEMKCFKVVARMIYYSQFDDSCSLYDPWGSNVLAYTCAYKHATLKGRTYMTANKRRGCSLPLRQK